jgi:hypothetical protein
MITKAPGTPASNQYGKFAVKYASSNQQRFITKLLAERKHELGELDPSTVALKEASAIIDTLLRCPVKVDRSRVCSEKQASFIESLASQVPNGKDHLSLVLMENAVRSVAELPAQVATEVINKFRSMPVLPREVQVDVGAYKYEGIVYSVRRARESKKLHAYHWSTDSAEWVYSGNIKYQLRPEHRLTHDEAREFGATTGTCVHCGRTLTDEASVRYGMGSTCRRKYS